MYYIIKKTEDGYAIKSKTDTAAAPRGCFSIKADDFKFPKIVDTDGVLTIENDTEKLAAFNAKKITEDEIAMRMKRIQFGQRLISIMSIRNEAKSLTGAQIVQLVQDFSSINTAWLNGSIQTSRSLIDALTPDGTILTTADKTAILAEIDANLTALGY